MVFIDSISWHSQVLEGFHFGGLRFFFCRWSGSVGFIRWWLLAASCEGAQRKISTFKSETMVLCQKRWSAYFGSGTSYYPRWRSSGALGSSLWVRREENRRLTDKLGNDCIESDAASVRCGKKGEMTTKAKQTEVVLSKSSAWHSFLDVFQCDGSWILFREAAGVCS